MLLEGLTHWEGGLECLLADKGTYRPRKKMWRRENSPFSKDGFKCPSERGKLHYSRRSVPGGL